VTEYGVLALQGGWAAHGAILRELGAHAHPVRTAADLARIDALEILLAEFGIELLQEWQFSQRVPA